MAALTCNQVISKKSFELSLVPNLCVGLVVCRVGWGYLKFNGTFSCLFSNEGDLSLIRKNRMALFQQLTQVLPILDNLLEASVITKQEHDIIRQKTQIPLQARELIDTVLVKGNAAANIFKNSLKEIDSSLYENLFVGKSMKYVPAEDVSGLSLEEQLRRLQEERTCKVCMDREVSIVFIPCGHLVVCQECAPSLRKCPICRGTIKGTVRTFLS